MARKVAANRHARLLAVAELLSPSLNGPSSHRLAKIIEAGALDSEVAIPAQSSVSEEDLAWLAGGFASLSQERLSFWTTELENLTRRGVRIVDSAEEEYPTNLRMIHNRPPFLMVRGTLAGDDDRAVAVVGTRKPTPRGRDAAYEIARELANRHVTVVSGLAEGIDTAAHSGALSTGGRTIAVFGTGIDVVYPPRNRALAEAIARSGACVSQFWPSLRGTRWTFPVRNLVTSGLSLGTVVVEAGETSGSRLQARAALSHGKRVFLLDQLVRTQPWARDILKRPGAIAVDCVDQILSEIEMDLATDIAVVV
ncbi:MAG: DNA-protecting protein DprA [Actinobacteria bacterium]|nr:DNA-protecting protein DprA [Actinomycetota bacterium]